MGLDADLTIQSFPSGYDDGRDQHEADKDRHLEKQMERSAKAHKLRQKRAMEARRTIVDTIELLSNTDLPLTPHEALRELLSHRHALEQSLSRIPTSWSQHYYYIGDARLIKRATEAIDALDSAAQTYRELIAEAKALHNERQRKQRLANRTTPIAEMVTRRCVSCNSKPARIDDYCKKCAREHGIVVHGKI